MYKGVSEVSPFPSGGYLLDTGNNFQLLRQKRKSRRKMVENIVHVKLFLGTTLTVKGVGNAKSVGSQSHKKVQ